MMINKRLINTVKESKKYIILNVIFQWLTMVLPPRYFITFIESEFMAGTVWEVVIINSIFLTILGLILFAAVYKNTEMRLVK